jgi:hypothetical protein
MWPLCQNIGDRAIANDGYPISYFTFICSASHVYKSEERSVFGFNLILFLWGFPQTWYILTRNYVPSRSSIVLYFPP